ncbi:MAG: hypothetical protein WCJ64_25385, partial [Rhodospirillaceae bacterium]
RPEQNLAEMADPPRVAGAGASICRHGLYGLRWRSCAGPTTEKYSATAGFESQTIPENGALQASAAERGSGAAHPDAAITR